MPISLSNEQQDAIAVLKSNSLCLFSGPPGSGKTTTLAHWLKGSQSVSTAYMAPTGKAAQRMTEAFAEADLEAGAQTIHSSLHPLRSGHDGGDWEFRYNLTNPLPVDRIVVDECSMIDLSLMRSLLDATGDRTQLILTGDPNQLPPVGAGRPFLDMINSEQVTHARLATVHRNAGRGAQICQQIKRGEPITFSPKLNLDLDAGEFGPENTIHIENSDPDQIANVIVKCVEKIADRGQHDPVTDVQVICFTNRSRENLNLVLQDCLNPHGESISELPFRVNDKVMCLKNQWRPIAGLGRKGPDLDKYRKQKKYVANGETGRVTYLSSKLVLVQFPRSSGSLNSDVHVQYSIEIAKKELTLAYAITCHKSQGGGWPVVIYVADKSIKCDRALIYTAFSRFSKICISIGQKAVINRQVRDTNVRHRFTQLSNRLQGAGVKQGNGWLTDNTKWIEVDNVTQIESKSHSRKLLFDCDDSPEWIPESMICFEGETLKDGQTGSLLVRPWIALKKLQTTENHSEPEQGGFPCL